MPVESRSIGLTATLTFGPVSMPYRWSISTDRPSNCWSELRLPSLLPFRVPSNPFTRSHLSVRAPPAWVPALFATSPGASTILRGFPGPRFVPPSSFLSSSAVYSALRLRRLVSSRSHVKVSFRVQGLLSRCSQAFSSKVVHSLPFQPEPSPTNLGCQVRARRLRGFAPHRVAFCRPGFSQTGSRCPLHVCSPETPCRFLSDVPFEPVAFLQVSRPVRPCASRVLQPLPEIGRAHV